MDQTILSSIDFKKTESRFDERNGKLYLRGFTNDDFFTAVQNANVLEVKRLATFLRPDELAIIICYLIKHIADENMKIREESKADMNFLLTKITDLITTDNVEIQK